MIYHENVINYEEAYLRYMDEVNKSCYDSIPIPISFLTAEAFFGDDRGDIDEDLYESFNEVISSINNIFLSYYYDKKYLPIIKEFSFNINDLDLAKIDSSYTPMYISNLIMCNSYNFIRNIIFSKCYTLYDFNAFFKKNYTVMKVMFDMAVYMYWDCLGKPTNLESSYDTLWENREVVINKRY